MKKIRKRKPRVLFYQDQTIEFFVEGGVPLGGSAMETFVWMKTLSQLDIDVYQFQTSNDRRPTNSENFWIKIIKTYDDRIRRRWYWFWYRLPVICFLLLRYRIDCVYTAIPTWETFYYATLCRLLGIRHVVRIASDNITSRRDGTEKREIDQIFKSISLADFIAVQNQYQFKVVGKRFPSARIVLLYNPIEIVKDFHLVKDEMNGFIAWVANFRDVKNMALLYEIAKNLQEESFRIAGEPLTPLESETEVALEKLKELPNVEFVGRVERESILEFFRGAKYLLNTSKFEGFSNTFLEAMITGTPILTTPKVNPDGIIDSFGLGILYVEASDLARKLSSMHRGEYAKLSFNCLNYVAERHDHLHLGKQLKALLLNDLKE